MNAKKQWFRDLEALFSVALVILLLAACEFEEEYPAATPVAMLKIEDFNDRWSAFYLISDGVGSDNIESVFLRSHAIDGKSRMKTFTYPEGESVVDFTIEYADEYKILIYEDGGQAEVTIWSFT